MIFPASTMFHAFSVYWVYAKSSLLDAIEPSRRR